MDNSAAANRLKPRIVTQRVLVVASDSSDPLQLQQELQAFGMPAATVTSRLEAVAAFQRIDPDIVLLCPDSDDPEANVATLLAHRIRRLCKAGAPMLALISQEALARARVRAPFDFVMTGSEDPRFLYRTIRRLIQRQNGAQRREKGAGTDRPIMLNGHSQSNADKAPAVHTKAQPFFHMLYVSRSLVSDPRGMDDRVLYKIGTQARFENARHGITGALIHENGFFMQLIEGFERNVVRLMANIENDLRHTDVEIIEARPASTRLFDDWSMICFDVKPLTADPEHPAFNPRGIEGDVLVRYLQALVRHAGTTGVGSFKTPAHENPAGRSATVDMF